MLWFDVTSLLRWNRPPVGIIRTELECARSILAEGDPDVRFCATEQHRLVVISHEEVRARIDMSSSQLHAAPPELAVLQGGSARLRAALGSMARGISPVRWLVRGLRRTAGAARAALVPSRPVGGTTSARADAALGIGDAYVSAGIDWDDKDEALLLKLKQTRAVRITRLCYDLIPVKLPQLAHPSSRSAKAEGYFVDLARSADVVACISERTRADFIEFLDQTGTPVPRCETIRLGGELPSGPAGELPAALVARPFILYVSSIERRKNHQVIVNAYARLVEEGHGDILPLLVFVGMWGWGVKDMATEIGLDPRLAHRILILGDIDDDTLVSLYRNCRFTVFPSFYEGWGLGISESLAAGKFCLASNAGALPEAGGDLVEYIDPLDGLGWSRRLLHYIRDDDALRAQEARIRSDYTVVGWETTARRIMALARQAGDGISPRAS